MAKHLVKSRDAGFEKQSYGQRFRKDMRQNWQLYLLFLPVILFYLIFKYYPMYGAVIAFKDYSPLKSIMESEWVGLTHFKTFFASPDFTKLLFNTLNISLQMIIFGFPAPIILALLMNEIQSTTWKKIVQTTTYLPHFISVVTICGILRSFVSDSGFITEILYQFGLVDKVDLLSKKELFVPIYIITDIWQSVGWGSILYLAALSGIDQELYEAASIDGANRWRQLFAVTLPGLAPTIVVMFILRVGNIMNLGFEKIILLYNPLTREVADIISTYVYRRGLIESNFSFSSAVGLFNGIINFLLVTMANGVSKKINETSLW